MMKKKLLLAIVLLTLTNGAYAFYCQANRVVINVPPEAILHKEKVPVTVNLQPTLLPNENLVIDLSPSIQCVNTAADTRRDFVSLNKAAFVDSLKNFSGEVEYYGIRYALPVTVKTSRKEMTKDLLNWEVRLLLKPKTAAGGVIINVGDAIAELELFQEGENKSDGGEKKEAYFTWIIKAANNVVIPTGSCDVSARNLTVNLPDYPPVVTPGASPSGNPTHIPLTIHCTQNQRLKYKISGKTVDGNNQIFANIATGAAAKGIGIQVFSKGKIISAGSTISLGRVGTKAVDLDLSTNYILTGEEVTAGPVQSIVYIKFDYQ